MRKAQAASRNPPLLSPRRPKRWVTPADRASRNPLAHPPYRTVATAPSIRHHIRIDPAARDRGFANAVAVVAGDHDRISVRVDAGDDADMTAAATARHHGDGADLRAGDARAVMRERVRHVGAGALMAGLLKHHVHEARAPQAAAARRVAAE